MRLKKFRSPAGELRVALSSGHTAIIDEKGIELDEKFWKEAYAVGALTGDMEDLSAVAKAELEAKEAKESAEKEHQTLIDFLNSVYDDPRNFLTKDNQPNAIKISAATGVKIDKKSLTKLWDEVVASRE